MKYRYYINIAIFIKILFFNSLIITAQTQCEQYIQRIDSLIKKKYFDTYDQGSEPTDDCQPYLLRYTGNKGYLGDSTDYYITDILRYLSEKGVTQTIREQAVNELLMRNYHYDVSSIYYEFNKNDFNRQAKNRLKTLLRKQYTTEEKNRYIEDNTKYIFEDTLYVSGIAYDVFKKKHINYEKAKDSVKTATKDSIKTAVLEKYSKKLYDERYSIYLPLLTGWLNMKECIPLLDSIQKTYDNLSFKIALARLGNKKYQQDFLNQETINMNIAFYIGSQELIAKYGEKLYSEEEKYFIQPGSPIPIVYNVIIDLQNNLSNFPKLIDEKICIVSREEIDKLPPDVLEKARQWMKENKGKYIISPDFNPDF
jgi:hypothetical protein